MSNGLLTAVKDMILQLIDQNMPLISGNSHIHKDFSLILT